MTKNLKNLAILFSSALLAVGCGTADTGGDPKVTDITAPIIEGVTPTYLRNTQILALDEPAITFTLSEAIDESTLIELNQLEIKSTNDVLLEGVWTFESSTNVLSFTFDSTPLPGNEQFNIDINGEVTDKAGNGIVYSLTFNTEKTYSISVQSDGLEASESVKVTQTDNPDTATDYSVTITGDSVGNIDSNLVDGATFTLSISEYPDNKSCVLSSASGTIGSKNAAVQVNCHDVIPYYSDAPLWNDYHIVGGNNPPAHGGENRAVIITGLDSCDGISATDSLGAFDWSCETANTDESSQIKVFSTKLKQEKGLSDLLNFSDTPSWKENSITVKDGNGQNIKITDLAIWWNNPVTVTPDTKALTSKSTIYVHVDKNGNEPDLLQSFEIQAQGIALVINPDIILATQVGGILLDNSSLNTTRVDFWIEGKINAINSNIGIDLKSTWNGRLRNITLSNSQSNGISLSKSPLVTITNVKVVNSSDHGLVIDDSVLENFGPIVSNSLFSNSGKSGVSIDSSYAHLLNINANSNQEDGITLNNGNNIVSNVYLNNNVGNGLAFNGSHNNLVSNVTASNNDGHGISFSISSNNNPTNNIIHLATIANNNSNAINFDSELSQANIDTNKLTNILSAYNTTNSCADCENIVTVTTTDTTVEEIFTSVSSDSSVSNYSDGSYTAKNDIDNFPSLENIYRSWGSTTSPSDTTGSGSCLTEITCKIYDWSLNSNDTLAINKIDEPTTQVTFDRAGDNIITYLENSVEINNDELGNNNGFCESNESCILIRNTGSYQGHDSLSTYSSDNDIWSALDIDLQTYETNGR